MTFLGHPISIPTRHAYDASVLARYIEENFEGDLPPGSKESIEKLLNAARDGVHNVNLRGKEEVRGENPLETLIYSDMVVTLLSRLGADCTTPQQATTQIERLSELTTRLGSKKEKPLGNADYGILRDLLKEIVKIGNADNYARAMGHRGEPRFGYLM